MVRTSPIRVLAVSIVLLGTACELDSGTPTPTEIEHPPQVVIQDVTDGALLYSGRSSWEFRGLVADPDDPDYTHLNITFKLLHDAQEVSVAYPVPDSTGTVALKSNYLEDGDYTLYLEAEDATGLTASQTVAFAIGNQAPSVEVLSPAAGTAVDQWVAFEIQAQVTDVDNPPERGFQASLVIAGVEADTRLTEADGSVTFSYLPQQEGPLELIIAVTDELGAAGSAALDLIVNPCTDNDGDGIWTCPDGDLPPDCDDHNADIAPGFPEACDGQDSNCDSLIPVDELDEDGDGVSACAGDCNEGDPTTYAGALELCDGLDNDCDFSLPSWEEDADGDGYRGCAGESLAADCNDGDDATYPGAAEICDAQDSDCDGVVAGDEEDVDGDHVPICAGDCDDTNPYTFPGAVERLDLKDNDCDGSPEGVVRLNAAQARYDGTQGDSQTGAALFAGGDVNGDGIGDLAIGAPRYVGTSGSGTLRGAVYLVFGGAEGWTAEEGSSLADAVILTETVASAQAGAAVSMADLDQDGTDDLLVGAPGYSEGNLIEAGGVYLVSGRESWSSDDLSAVSRTLVQGSSSDMNLGSAISGPGDINGDRTPDVAIGAPWSSRRPTAPGMIAVLSGRSNWSSRTTLTTLARINGADSAALGVALAIGSSTDDATSDIVAGGLEDPTALYGVAYWVPGNTSIRQGSQTTVTSLGAKYYDGDTSYERVGSSVGGGVDVDGDGYDDALVGRYTDGSPGDAAAYLFFGGDELLTSGAIEEVAPVRFQRTGSDECPCAVVGIGDWNGDGLGDFAISASRANDSGSDSGKVYLFLGRSGREAWSSIVGLDTADGILVGEAAGDGAGSSLAGGDINGDGLSDLIIGAPNASGQNGSGSAVSKAGRVYVVLGSHF